MTLMGNFSQYIGAMALEVHAEGSVSQWVHYHKNNCTSIVALPPNIITSQVPPVLKEWGGNQRPLYIESGYLGGHLGCRGDSVQIPNINQPKSSRWNNEIMPLTAFFKSISWELNTWLEEGATGLRARIWVMGGPGGTLGGWTQPKNTKVAPWSEVIPDISTSSVVS